MFKSLASICVIPATIKPYKSRNGTGAITYGDDIDIRCYAQAKVQSVVNTEGNLVISNTQLYIPGAQLLGVLDAIQFEGSTHAIKSIGTYYWDGTASIKVVYI